MGIDVSSDIVILRPRSEVAAFAADPDNVPAWYVNINSVVWETPRPVAVGSRIAFVAKFMARQMAYTYEITELVPGERLVMGTTTGPMRMQTIYEWEEMPGGNTRMVLRNRGEASGLPKLFAPLMAPAVRRANRKDLARLKQLLERPPAAAEDAGDEEAAEGEREGA